LQKYEARKKVLDLNIEKNTLQIELEKERMLNNRLKKDVETLNEKANKTTDRFSPSAPSATASDAKAVAKLLKDVEKSNKSLEKSNKKLRNLQSEIDKIQGKMDKLNKQIEFVEVN